MSTAQSVYRSSVVALPKSELTASVSAVLDFSDSWSEEDVRDVTSYASYAADYAAEVYGEEPNVG